MNIVVEIYLIICVCLLLFDIVFLVLKNHRNQELYPRNHKIEEMFQQQIGLHRQTGAFSEAFLEKLPKRLSHTRNLIMLMDILDQDAEAADWFRPAVFAQLPEYQKKNDYEQAYYAYAISCFNYEQKPVSPEFASRFLAFLDSKSLYTFANTMDAVYQFGETNFLLTALNKVDQRQGSYHQKLLIDGLLASRANFEELNRALVQQFDRYTPFMQECLLDFFRMNGFDASELCMSLLKKEGRIDTEVRFGAMRYFMKCHTSQSKDYFLDILKKDNVPWIDQMLAIQALENDNADDVWEAIMKKVNHRNWYVRSKSVSYLYHHGLTKEQVFDILYLRDQYTNDALLYQCRGDKELTRYIIDTIQLLRRQDVSGIEHMDAALASV